jgi:Zn-dependent protease/CBS domain-containing protein
MDLGVLLIGGLLTWTLASLILPNSAPGLVSTVYWTVGIVGAVLFLGSLLAHEMAHAIVARRNDVKVEGITLWLFGGFAQFENEPRTPGAEFRITAAGPGTSIGLAGLFGAGAFGISALGAPQVYVSLLAWLAVINAFLGVFNLLPGAPLDGGRILAAAIWKVRGDRVTGRIGAANAGKVVGLGLVGLGLFEMFVVRGFGGLWTALIGWFLFSAARAEHVHFVGERAIGDMTVGEAMAPDPPTTTTWASIAEVVDGPLRHTNRSAVAVTDWQGRGVGIITMDDVRRVPADQWGSTTVAQIIGDGSQLAVLAPSDRLVDVLDRLGTAGPAVVVADGALVGVLGSDEVRRAVEIGRLRGTTSPRATPPPPPVSAPDQRWEPPLPTR